MYIKSWFKSFSENKDDFNGCCICPICNYSIPHRVGRPCRGQMCPNCNVPLIRSDTMKKNDDRDMYQDVQKQNQNVFPKVDRDLCIGCGSCIDMCPRQAITLEEDKAFIHEDQCANCRACVTLCPVGAIN